MYSVFGFILFSFLLFSILWFGFMVWARPKEYMKYIHMRRTRLKSRMPFLPDWLIGYIFFYERPTISIWWARILTLIGILMCILGMIATIHGPF